MNIRFFCQYYNKCTDNVIIASLMGDIHKINIVKLHIFIIKVMKLSVYHNIDKSHINASLLCMDR